MEHSDLVVMLPHQIIIQRFKKNFNKVPNGNRVFPIQQMLKKKHKSSTFIYSKRV